MQNSTSRTPRPPVVTVLGHIDHGKSTLLDYIRKTKTTDREAGGITQHISAYEVLHPDEHGVLRPITFLDTPGHEAFQHLRSRGSNAADLAILVVAADDGVKPQTLQALKAIEEARIPFIVALSKIDKSNADLERAKYSLLEHGVYLEGQGGTVPFVPISSKTGEGISTLLSLLLLAADLEELTGDPSLPGTGVIIESHCDPKSGISASLIVKDGSIAVGQYIVAGHAFAPLRALTDYAGGRIQHASFSSPVVVTGWNEIPPVGTVFTTVNDKVRARDEAIGFHSADASAPELFSEDDVRFRVPVIIKTDVVGSIDAIKHELAKYNDAHTFIDVVREGVGAVTEADIKHAIGSKHTIVVAFAVGTDSAAEELAQRMHVAVLSFRVIYELADLLPEAIRARRPRVRVERVQAEAKVLKSFSASKKAQTVGLRVLSGEIEQGQRIKVVRNHEELGRGTIESLQSGKSTVTRVSKDSECGAQLSIELDVSLTYGDSISAVEFVEE